jgi:hypothetical protein
VDMSAVSARPGSKAIADDPAELFLSFLDGILNDIGAM